jgi:hypothetical protein
MLHVAASPPNAAKKRRLDGAGNSAPSSNATALDSEHQHSRVESLQSSMTRPQSPFPLPASSLRPETVRPVSTVRAVCRAERVAHWYWQDDLGGWRRYLDLDRYIEAQYRAFQLDQLKTPSLAIFSYTHETNVTYSIDFVQEIQSRVPHVTPTGQLYQVRRVRRVERKLFHAPQVWPKDWIDVHDAAMRLSRSQRTIVPAPFPTSEAPELVSCHDILVSPMLTPTDSASRNTVEVLLLDRGASESQPSLDLSCCSATWSPSAGTNTAAAAAAAASVTTVAATLLARAASKSGSSVSSHEPLTRFVPASMYEREYVLQPLELNGQLYQSWTEAYLSSVTQCIRRSPASVAAVLVGSTQPQSNGSSSHPDFITTGYRASVVGAWQIQSPRVLARYEARRQRMQEDVDSLGVVSVEQRTLFHGTSLDALPYILRDGLRAPLNTASSDRALRGHGVYLARAASFATYYAQQHKDPLAVVLVCDALVGLSELGERGQREARRVPNAEGRTFHSTCDALWNAVPTQYCLWNSDQVLPVAVLFVKCEPLPAPYPSTAAAVS